MGLQDCMCQDTQNKQAYGLSPLMRTKSVVTKVARKRQDFGFRVNKEMLIQVFLTFVGLDALIFFREEQDAKALMHSRQMFSWGLLGFFT